MKLTVITASGKKHIFKIASVYLVKYTLRIIQEPIRNYTLLRDDGGISTIMVSN